VIRSRLKELPLDVSPLREFRDFRLLFQASTVSVVGSEPTFVTIPLVGLIRRCELVLRGGRRPGSRRRQSRRGGDTRRGSCVLDLRRLAFIAGVGPMALLVPESIAMTPVDPAE
jgi:hypothetical protein